MDKELNEYFKAKKALANKRLSLAQKLLMERPFAKHFSLYINNNQIIFYRINDYEDGNRSLKYWVGSVSGVNIVSSEDLFKRNFIYELDSILDKEKYKNILLFEENSNLLK